MTNGDPDPGQPGPPIPYEDRLGCAKDLPLLTWRAGGFEYQGNEEAHQERTDASLRDATLDIEAREKWEQSELESRKKHPQTKTEEPTPTSEQTKERLDGGHPRHGRKAQMAQK